MKILSQIMRCSSFIFEENHISIEEETPQKEEDLDGIDTDCIRNLMDLPRLMFIDKECGNFK